MGQYLNPLSVTRFEPTFSTTEISDESHINLLCNLDRDLANDTAKFISPNSGIQWLYQ